jgi:hypothetical protein
MVHGQVGSDGAREGLPWAPAAAVKAAPKKQRTTMTPFAQFEAIV